MKEEQLYLESRKLIISAAHIFKEAKRRLIEEYIKTHYPGLEFSVKSSDTDLTLDLTFFNVPLEESKVIGNEIIAYMDQFESMDKEYVCTKYT